MSLYITFPFNTAFPTVKRQFGSTQLLNGYNGEDLEQIVIVIKDNTSKADISISFSFLIVLTLSVHDLFIIVSKLFITLMF